MGDPRNPARKNETYDLVRLALQLHEIEAVRSLAPILSGGWAWHFLSPPHTEFKVLHDHTDIDLFVNPPEVQDIRRLLLGRGFERAKTQWDRNDFFRLTKSCETGKIVFDIFIQTVPAVIAQGHWVVDPAYLLSLYKTVHQSGDCVAVAAARGLLAAGLPIIGSPDLVRMP
jgi:hypothetical protein